nr:flavodoxin [Clostridioides difficile]
MQWAKIYNIKRMVIMRKIFCILLSSLLVSSLVACSNQNPTNTEKPVSTSENSSLVVFYSATGNTKIVAEKIAQTLDADIFEIIPEEPYTDEDLNWSNDNSRVSIEHNDESKREIPLTDTMPDGWEQYDTIYIGYPIWWGIAAWPVNGFIEANDFTDKTVIPFCTSASSGLGDSSKLLKGIAKTGNWIEGKRFSSNVNEEEIIEWLNTLKLNQ